MKTLTRIMACLLAVVALVVAAVGIWVSLRYRNALPIVIEPSKEAANTADRLLAAVEKGDYEAAGGMILGNPSLGVKYDEFGRVILPESDDEAMAKLTEMEKETLRHIKEKAWFAYQSSLKFTPQGDVFVTEAGVARTYQVRYLKVNTVIDDLRQRSEQKLTARVEAAEATGNVSDVLDENGDYREDIKCAVLLEAAEEALAEALEDPASYEQWSFTMNLVYQDGAWWAKQDPELIRAISGSLTE